MDIVALSILLVAIMISDEVLNGQVKVSQRLLKWFEKKSSSRSRTQESPKKS